jgi:aspartate/methionine/tyrosine aminotransferase
MFADRMESVPFSGIREIFEAAASLEAGGVDVVQLLIGRPDFDTPDPIKEAAIEAIRDGKVHYTSNYGIEPLRAGIADKLAADCGLEYDPDSELVVTTGVTEAVVSTVFSFAGPGDEVLVPDPAWTYPASVAMAGAEAVPYRMAPEDGFQPDVDHLREQVSEDTTLLIVNSPHNPTGGVLSEARARELRDFAVEHDLVVLSDEIYEQIVFGDAEHHSLATFDGMRERTVTVNGFSKAYSMTGWRLGYMAAPEELVDALVRVRQYTTTCAPSISQWAGVRALEGDLQDPLVAAFEERAARTAERIDGVPGMEAPAPRGAFYAFPTVPAGYDDGTEFAYDLLEATGVAVVPGDAFGDQPDRVRIAYSNSLSRIDEAFDRIEAFVGE